MKTILIFALVIAGCNTGGERQTADSVSINQDTLVKTDNTAVEEFPADSADLALTTLSNDRFRNVTVRKISPDSAKVSGTARIFEATLSYAVYEKGKQLYEGFHTASAGAPEWGSFDFNIALPSSSGDPETYIIVFESSAKDGSRVGILKFPL